MKERNDAKIRINCHSQLRNEVCYERGSLLRIIFLNKNFFVTFRELPQAKPVNCCYRLNQATAPRNVRFFLPRDKPSPR